MRCIVTAGPTYEPLDAVRRLTNSSTGRLGSELARHLAALGHEITLLLGEQAPYRTEFTGLKVVTFGTAADLGAKLHRFSEGGIGAVFHAAAVSDFAFGQVSARGPGGELKTVRSGKFSTRQGVLLAELVPTQKIIGRLREWFPAAKLVGWKFEVEGGREDVIRLGKAQIRENKTDACVLNGPAYGEGFGILQANAGFEHVETISLLYERLAEWL
jgi:phosphopantothenoylcysteine synthetase/decarboxylase